MIVPTVSCLRSALSAGFLIKLHKRNSERQNKKC